VSRPPAWFIPAFGLLRTSVALIAIAGVALAVGLIFRPGGGDEAKAPALVSSTSGPSPTATPWPVEAVEALAKQDEAPATCEPPERQDLRIVSADELRAQGLIDLGRVVFVGHCPLYVANRADRTVAWLGGGGYVKVDFSRGRGFGACCSYGRISYGDQEYSVNLYAPTLVGGQFRGLILRDSGLVEVMRAYENGTYVMLDLREWVPTSPGAISVGPAHRVALSANGHLFLDPKPLSGSTATNWVTGESIDVSILTRIGSLPLINGGPIRNDCYAQDGVCSVQYDNGPLLAAPIAGELRCVDDGGGIAFDLDSGSLRLRFTTFGGYKFVPADCRDRRVAAGEPLPGATYVGIKAFAADGSPLSLVVTRDGRLFAGQVKLQLGCPCEPRS
jgi:hypothetical protein